MSVQEILIVDGDDWFGMYVNGELRAEGHSITWQDLAEHCPIGRLHGAVLTADGMNKLMEAREFRSFALTTKELEPYLHTQ